MTTSSSASDTHILLIGKTVTRCFDITTSNTRVKCHYLDYCKSMGVTLACSEVQVGRSRPCRVRHLLPLPLTRKASPGTPISITFEFLSAHRM